jgi:lipopolysaccharide/colanic/teichoic acid biosynthesis glycosyltransferase
MSGLLASRFVYSIAKRALDVFVSFTALVVMAPALAVVAAAVRLDSSGPVLFRQDRLGRDGRSFVMLKFRTMKRDSSVVVGPDCTASNPDRDPRVTRIGWILRRTSVDELPQLVNVLRGQMSLVGPRPDLPVALDMYSDRQRRKLRVKPGITGLSQTSGRNLLDATEKWNLDAQYVDSASFSRDLIILAKTAWLVVKREGVYRKG